MKTPVFRIHKKIVQKCHSLSVIQGSYKSHKTFPVSRRDHIGRIMHASYKLPGILPGIPFNGEKKPLYVFSIKIFCIAVFYLHITVPFHKPCKSPVLRLFQGCRYSGDGLSLPCCMLCAQDRSQRQYDL